MDDLQFERADFGAAPAKTCTGCHQPIAGDYYDVNGQPFCPACRASLAQAHGAGAGTSAIGRALVAGVAAGAVGSALFFVVERISGYPLSIIAIAVGFLVGRAVRWGTGGRGGLLYQAMAVVLTYVAIAFGALPFLVAASRDSLGLLDIPALTIYLLGRPIRQGLENPMGLVIIGIGLYEAWMFTAPVKLAISGPFRAAPPTSLPPVPPPPVPPAPPAVP